MFVVTRIMKLITFSILYQEMRPVYLTNDFAGRDCSVFGPCELSDIIIHKTFEELDVSLS